MAKHFANAIGIAGGQAGSFIQVGGTMSKPFFASHAAYGGVLSAIMALHGFKSSLDLIEGPQGLLATFNVQSSGGEVLALGLRDRWEMLNNTFRGYMACAMSHAMLDGLLDLRAGGIEVEKVSEIRLHLMPSAAEYLNMPVVSSGLAGKYSAQYCVAVALLDGEVREQQFTDKRCRDPKISDLMQRVKLIPCEEFTIQNARVEISYIDGEVTNREIYAVAGSPLKPFSWSTLTQKFIALVDGTISKKAAKDIVKSMDRWPDVDLLKLLGSLQKPLCRRTLIEALNEGLGDQSPGFLSWNASAD